MLVYVCVNAAMCVRERKSGQSRCGNRLNLLDVLTVGISYPSFHPEIGL